jgi:hypothetical protein
MTPGMIFYMVERMKRTPQGKYAKMMYEVGVFIFSLMVSLPASVALFPQASSMPASSVDEEL